ncbi:universal stress protein [Cryobacterium cheniae]|uniref:universal stress protein n=1 Tax=Cryobacterium cheniae TaxID=1259262 RepID=UPI00141B942A|nr:universal stress protein [Cryobacterium cheniae]
MTPLLVAVGWVLVGLAAAFVMIRRGHDALIWVVLGVAAGPFSIALAGLAAYLEREELAESAVIPGESLEGDVRVLVCIDGSEAADHAAVTAVLLLGARLQTVTLLTVLDYDIALDVAPEKLDRIAAGIQSAAVTQLAALAVHPFSTRATGSAAEQILRRSGSGAYDLLALGTHRQRRSRFLGSVAREIANKSRIPLLTVRAAPVESIESAERAARLGPHDEPES